jgi:hypothetical protein
LDVLKTGKGKGRVGGFRERNASLFYSYNKWRVLFLKWRKRLVYKRIEARKQSGFAGLIKEAGI